MATNAETAGETAVVDDDTRVTEDDLRRDKEQLLSVEDPLGSDETDESDESDDDGSEDTGTDDGQTDDQAEDEDSEDDSTDDSDEETSEFVKEFDNIKGDTLEDYARSLEEAYRNSTTEAIRLKQENDGLKSTTSADDTKDSGDATGTAPVTDVAQLYAKQKMDQEITEAYTAFSKSYTQVNDPAEYNKFTAEVSTLSRTILDSQKRLASPAELYSKAAVILGWEPVDNKPTGKEKVGMALKSRAAVTKASSGPKKSKPASKVTNAMIIANRKMYPGKTDAEIQAELEPYVQ